MTRKYVTELILAANCGKSTRLNIIAGIARTNSGYAFPDGKETNQPGMDRMVLFQNFALMPWLTVSGNIRLVVKAAFRQRSKDQVGEWVRKYVEMVGLKGAEHKRPAELSGGMRQRVGLARAFSVNPRIMLLDEPFAQVDVLTRGVIQEELARMWGDTGITIFMVTHDLDEAVPLSDRSLLMTPGPHARIAREIKVDLPRPHTRAHLVEDHRFHHRRQRIVDFLTMKRTT